jgi:hypothetical protein
MKWEWVHSQEAVATAKQSHPLTFTMIGDAIAPDDKFRSEFSHQQLRLITWAFSVLDGTSLSEKIRADDRENK